VILFAAPSVLVGGGWTGEWVTGFDEIMSIRLWNEVNKGEELLDFDF